MPSAAASEAYERAHIVVTETGVVVTTDNEMAIAKLNSLDHDLLLKLDTKLDMLTQLFNETRTAVSDKADASRVDKIEAAVEELRRKIWLAAGGLAVLQFLLVSGPKWIGWIAGK